MYIVDFCSIGAYGVLEANGNTGNLNVLNQSFVSAQEPEYTNIIPPMQLRRMTKPLRIGVAAAKICMDNSHITDLGSIHIGTAYGMLADSENFLKKMIVQEEQMLNPTAFIQSTHNTVSGQIALGLGCVAHNMTFVHNAHSFESALLDAELFQTKDKQQTYCLIGAVEECIEASYEVLKRFNVYNESVLAGEGASFFIGSGHKVDNAIGKIAAYEMGMGDGEVLANTLQKFVNRNSSNSDYKNDLLLHGGMKEEMPALFAHCKKTDYKEYSGEYATSIGFALSLSLLKLREENIARCWIMNRFGNYFSFMLVTRP